jgi:hypothetical protein
MRVLHLLIGNVFGAPLLVFDRSVSSMECPEGIIHWRRASLWKFHHLKLTEPHICSSWYSIVPGLLLSKQYIVHHRTPSAASRVRHLFLATALFPFEFYQN